MTPEERLAELVAHRREELEAHAARVEDAVADLEQRESLVRDSRASVERLLRFGAADLEGREGDLVDLTQRLEEREARLRTDEDDLARRRGELGAVELKRAAVEQREAAVAAREAKMVALEDVQDDAAPPQDDAVAQTLIAFVPGDRYRLVELTSTPLSRGNPVAIDGEEYVVARFGPSPLPGDRRRCVYLVRGRRSEASDGGSS
jgi:hypothetical protein